MSFDGYFIKHLVNQLNKDISGGRIKKVFQTRKDAFVFLVYQKGNTYQLYFDLNPSSSHLSINQDINHTEEKSQFLTTLKKHLENTVITNIKQHLLDRVIILDIQGFDSIFGYLRKKLIFEVMGRSTNLIILDSNDVIIDAYYKQFHPDKRSVLTQAEFSFFPTTKVVLDDNNYDLFLSLDSQKAISDTFMGISKELARFFYDNKAVIKPWLLETSPHLYLGDKKYYHAIKITDESNSVPYDSIYTLINDFYKNQDFSKKDQITTLLDTQINKYTLKIQHLNGDLEKNIDYTRYKDIADAIYSSGLDLKTKVVSFDSVLLDEYKTLNDNAQLFYQKYHKFKKSIVPINEQLAIARDYLAYFTDIKQSLVFYGQSDTTDLIEEFRTMGLIKKDVKQPKNKKKAVNLLKVNVSDDSLIFVGKSSIQNNYLTHEIAHQNDLWFHVKSGPGAHVILRGTPNEENLRLAAMLAAYYSPNRDSSSIAVDYTLVKNIKKIKGRPGYYVSYTHQKTIYIDIDKALIENL